MTGDAVARPPYANWPKGFPRHVSVPELTLQKCLQVSAMRFPRKPALVYFDTLISFSRLQREVEAISSSLVSMCGASHGDRIVLLGQNCPQFVIAYYAILRAGCAVVPVNAMCTPDEIRYCRENSGAKLAICARELCDVATESGFDRIIWFQYADYLEEPTEFAVPDWVANRLPEPTSDLLINWRAALESGGAATSDLAVQDDICVLPYTSGTTGKPKACVHTHRSVLSAVWSAGLWRNLSSETVFLGTAPMFHMLGMQNGMNLPIALGATVIVSPRWDRTFAAMAIERYRVNAWTAPTAALLDFFASPDVDSFDLSSITLVTGGGGAVPATVSEELWRRFSVVINEGYGMTETASFLLCNPLQGGKSQCLGIPTFGVDAKIIDPETLQELPNGSAGEIVVSGSQLMKEYWADPEATAKARIELDGSTYLRTGDLGRKDSDGFFFLTDRLKRMINVSGFKVWPAEVEAIMYENTDIKEVCIVGVPDNRQGESVKAFIVLRQPGSTNAQSIIAWARSKMAVYKAPRQVEFVDEFPRSSTGKILWRLLG